MQTTAILYASPAVDEIAHLTAGLSIWETHQLEMYKVNPPLVKLVAAIPVCYMNPRTERTHVLPDRGTMRLEFFAGREFVRQNGERSVSMFRAARFACLPFSIIGAYVCFLWGRAAFAKTAGLFAAGMWAFSPMVLGHGSLITPDVPAAAMGVLALFRFRQWLLARSWWNAFVFGLASGLALLTKFTWVPILPATVLIALSFWKRENGDGDWRSDFCQMSLAAFIAIYCVNAMYGFDRSFTPLGAIPFFSKSLGSGDRITSESLHQSSGDAIELSNSEINRFSDSWLGQIPVPVPVCYLQGIDIQKIDFERPQRSYLMGEWKSGGWWYYYIAAILVKEPLPALALALVACIVFIVPILRLCRNQGSRAVMTSCQSASENLPMREHLLLAVPAILVVTLVSSQTNMNHHVRYILPAFPFAFIGSSRNSVGGV